MSYSKQNKQYDVKYNLTQNLIKVALEDHYFESNPPALSKVFEYISKFEKIRNDVFIEYNENGRFGKIKDIDTLSQNWNHLKTNELDKIEFIQKIREMNPAEYNFMISEGDRQFRADYDHKSDFDRDLFYIVLLDKYLVGSEFETEKYKHKSQLLPSLEIPMETRYHIIDEDDEYRTIRKVSETIFSEELLKDLEENYDKYHKPLIKYKFTSYKLDVRNTFTYHKESKILKNAELSIIEDIEHNIKTQIKYTLRKIS